MDLAVAVTIGAAFSNFVNSLVRSLNLILGVLVGRPDDPSWSSSPSKARHPQTLVKAGATVFGYGAFLTAVV